MLSPAGMALSAGREQVPCTAVGVEVAGLVGSEHSSDVVTRRAIHCRRLVGVTLAVVRVALAVEAVVITDSARRHRRWNSRRGPPGIPCGSRRCERG